MKIPKQADMNRFGSTETTPSFEKSRIGGDTLGLVDRFVGTDFNQTLRKPVVPLRSSSVRPAKIAEIAGGGFPLGTACARWPKATGPPQELEVRGSRPPLTSSNLCLSHFCS